MKTLVLTDKELGKIKNDLRYMAEETAKKFYPIFKLNGWKYRGEEITEDDLYFNIMGLITNLYSGKQSTCVRSGRIQIRVTKWDHSIEARIELVPETNWISYRLDSFDEQSLDNLPVNAYPIIRKVKRTMKRFLAILILAVFLIVGWIVSFSIHTLEFFNKGIKKIQRKLEKVR